MPFFTRSLVSAATSGTFPSSSVQPNTMNAEPALLADAVDLRSHRVDGCARRQL